MAISQPNFSTAAQLSGGVPGGDPRQSQPPPDNRSSVLGGTNPYSFNSSPSTPTPSAQPSFQPGAASNIWANVGGGGTVASPYAPPTQINAGGGDGWPNVSNVFNPNPVLSAPPNPGGPGGYDPLGQQHAGPYMGNPSANLPPWLSAPSASGSSSSTAGGSSATSPMSPFSNFGSTPNGADPTGGQTYNPLTNPMLTGQISTGFMPSGSVTSQVAPTATLSAAQQFAQALGGSVVTQGTPWQTSTPVYLVQLPNGQTVDATALANILGNNAQYANSAVKSGEIAKLMGMTYDPSMANLASALAGGTNANLARITSPPPPMMQGSVLRDNSGAQIPTNSMGVPQTGNGGIMTPPPAGGTGSSSVGSTGSSNALGQLAAFYSLISGGGGNLMNMLGQQGGGQQQQSAGGLDSNTLSMLLMLLNSQSGGGQQAPLYSRSQYPKFA